MLNTLRGGIAVGHCRYSTSGLDSLEEREAMFRGKPAVSLALGHNGNLIRRSNRAWLACWRRRGAARPAQATSDTDVLTALFARGAAGPGPSTGKEDVRSRAWRKLHPPAAAGPGRVAEIHGRQTLYAARDPRVPAAGARGAGTRLGGGQRDRGAGHRRAIVVREVEPGELIAIDERGVRSRTVRPAAPQGCVFEYVYMARPDTSIGGRGVQATRVAVGPEARRRAPGRGRPGDPGARVGHPGRDRLRRGSGIPYGQGLVKNSYVGRTFIQPSQTIRQRGIRLKLNPLRDVIEGKRMVVVDDSIMRGNTQRAIIACCARRGPRRCTSASPARRWPGRASTASTSRPGPS